MLTHGYVTDLHRYSDRMIHQLVDGITPCEAVPLMRWQELPRQIVCERLMLPDWRLCQPCDDEARRVESTQQ